MRYLLPITLIFLCSCQPIPPQDKAPFSQIYPVIEAGDRRDIGALGAYLNSGSEEEKVRALMIAASINDEDLSPLIEKVIEGNDGYRVKSAAVFALGQNPSPAGLLLLKKLLADTSFTARESLFAALGKSVNERDDIPFEPGLSAGRAEGLYRMAARGMLGPAGVDQALAMIRSDDDEVRFYSAHALHRQREVDLTPYLSALKEAIEQEPIAEIRGVFIGSLKSSVGALKTEILKAELSRPTNPYSTVKAIRALGSEDVYWAAGYLVPILASPDYQAAMTAAIFLQNNFSEAFQDIYRQIMNEVKHVEVRCSMLGALSDGGDESAHGRLVDMVRSDSSLYSRIFAIQHLGRRDSDIKLLQELVEQDAEVILKGYALESIRESDTDKEQQDFFFKALESGDISMICHSATYFRDTRFENDSTVIHALKKCLDGLVLPRQAEGQVELSKTIAKLEGQTFLHPSPQFNHPVDSLHLCSLPHFPRIQVETSRGDILIELNRDKAPASVSAIIRLVESGFYNGKSFHRIVPDFVAQGGCPRGDGWGSPDFSIRSEFSDLRYETGTVGLASAGNDTESCQFFITHSATPHLDGRYTIIGKVIEGMDVVHQLTVGDMMMKVFLISN